MSLIYSNFQPKSDFGKLLALESLSTHLELDYHHVGLAAEVIARVKFSPEQLAKFILYSTLTTSTGQFALSFNHDLDLAVSQNNMQKLLYLVETDQDKFYPELYDNELLTPEEIKTILEIKNVEYQSILDVILKHLTDQENKQINTFSSNVPEQAATKLESEPHLLNLCPRTEEQFSCIVEGELSICTRNDITYNSCYKQICIEQKKENYLSSTLPNIIQVPSSQKYQVEQQIKHRILCMPYIKFIETLTVNPEQFAEHLLDNLRQLYGKEIKMYFKFLTLKCPDYCL